MPYNFINIFAGAVKTITIPSIQRDYAQGRKNLKVNRIRHKFLDALFNAVNGKNIKLDFVYGDLDKNGNLSDFPQEFMDEWTKQMLSLV